MLSFHGSDANKKQLLAHLGRWEVMNIRPKTRPRLFGWDGGEVRWTGDGSGTLVHYVLGVYSHELFAHCFGIPVVVLRAQETIFEELPHACSVDARKFIEVIPLGADLSGVWHQFCHWMLADPKERVPVNYHTEAAVQKVVELHARILDGGRVYEEEWYEARHVCDYSFASDDPLGDSVQAAGWAADWGRGNAHGWGDASLTNYPRRYEKLLELLQATPVR